MRIAILQFAPQVGDVDNNLNRADAVLSKANPKDLDLLVLPEMAFSGYNFKSLEHITPYLEPTASGVTSLWARTTALKYDCVVTAGYPEKASIGPNWRTAPEYYNSAITVNREGETIANYRKSFLYYTDEKWALEGPDGFFDGEVPGLGNVAMGICKWPTKSFERMDLNPYKFEAPWSAWEFAYHILHKQANLVILSMAWLTREDAGSFSRITKEPDMETLSYWLSRLEPVIRAESVGEIIVVFANRCGVEEDAVYAGTSCVLGINEGEVKVYGILGRGERKLLVVDTEKKPKAKLISEPNSAASNTTEATSNTRESMDTQPTTPDRDEFLASIDAVLAGCTPVTTPLSPTCVDLFPLSPSDIIDTPKADRASNSDPRPSVSTPPVIERPISPKSVNSSGRGSRNGNSQSSSRSSSGTRRETSNTNDLANTSEIDIMFSAQVRLPEGGPWAPSKRSLPSLAVEIPKSPAGSTLGTAGDSRSSKSPRSPAEQAPRRSVNKRSYSGLLPESPQSMKQMDGCHSPRSASRSASRMRTYRLPESPISISQLEDEKIARTASRNASRMRNPPPEVVTLPDSPTTHAGGCEEREARPTTRKHSSSISKNVSPRQPSRPKEKTPKPKTRKPINTNHSTEEDTIERTVVVFMNSRDRFQGNIVPYSASYIQTVPRPWDKTEGGFGPLPRSVIRRRHSLLW